ncbi:NPL4-like protein [Giardia muris]|uniref:NPL4-like protein n=1 Tax=Giardia muris TaxID=5742 RepID=A0A4Z1SRT2_GIAMU|nr:NPL4-like protein [Giardia muris]|eukprot:TNJ26348.1 NPL4-like protein [Giardia muris]
MWIIRVQSPIGQKRVELEEKSTVRDLMQAVADAFGLDIKVAAKQLCYDHGHASLVYAGATRSATTISECGLRHGTQLYLNLDRDLGEDEEEEKEDDTSPEALFKNIKSIKDLPRPPHKGRHCTHDNTIRCARCYSEWEEAFLRYIGKAREDLEMNDHILAAEGAMPCAALDPWDMSPSSSMDRERAKQRMLHHSGRISNVQQLKDNVTKFQLNIERQKTAFVRRLSIAASQMDEIRRCIDEGMFHRNLYGVMYGRFQYVSEDDKLKAYVFIDWIFLPPQECIAGAIVLKKDGSSKKITKAAEQIAAAFGLVNLGNFFTHFNDRGFILSATEISSLALRSARYEAKGAEYAKFMTSLRGTIDREKREFIVDAFAASRQLINLARNNVLIENRSDDPGNFVRFSQKQIFELKSSELVDAVCFLVPVALTTHSDSQTSMATGISSWSFPSPGGTCLPTLLDLKTYYTNAVAQKKSRQVLYGNCNLLLYLAEVLTLKDVQEIIQLVKTSATDGSFRRYDGAIEQCLRASGI